MTWLAWTQLALDKIPASKGSYLLVLQLAEEKLAQLNRFGTVWLPTGLYGYLGSACGPGGLRGRLKHHLAMPARPHWHIDWLRPALDWAGIYYRTGAMPVECLWVQALLRTEGAQALLKKFGASDCKQKCPAHLVYTPNLEALPAWVKRLEQTPGGNAEIE